jgi:hypothetical protein
VLQIDCERLKMRGELRKDALIRLGIHRRTTCHLRSDIVLHYRPFPSDERQSDRRIKQCRAVSVFGDYSAVNNIVYIGGANGRAR